MTFGNANLLFPLFIFVVVDSIKSDFVTRSVKSLGWAAAAALVRTRRIYNHLSGNMCIGNGELPDHIVIFDFKSPFLQTIHLFVSMVNE